MTRQDKQTFTHWEEKTRPGKKAYNFLVILGICCAVVALWATVSRLDIMSMAEGEVIPSSRTSVVQHLEGGIVKDILVREGEQVKQGQPLVVLEETISDAFFEEVQARIASLRLDMHRLQSLQAGQDQLELPAELQKKYQDLAEQTLLFFEAQQSAHESNLAAQRELISQKESQIEEIRIRRENSFKNLELLQEQIELSREMLQENMTTRYEHLVYLREEAALKSRIEEDAAALQATRAALSEARIRKENIRKDYREHIASQLKTTRDELMEMLQQQRRHADSLERTVLRSPSDGEIKTMHVNSVGEVITQGTDVAEIVPAGDQLVVEARLPVGDIGYVHRGQPATVRLATRDGAMYGRLEGEVVHVAPDTTVTEDGVTYYPVRVQTHENSFRHRDMEYSLYPGMHMQVSIHTGTRTVMEYILEPLLGTMSGVLQER